jgi:hypothetical protein
MENSNDAIRIRTRDLPACSSMPQRTAPPRGIYVNCGLFSDVFDIQLVKKLDIFVEFLEFTPFRAKLCLSRHNLFRLVNSFTPYLRNILLNVFIQANAMLLLDTVM